MKSNNASGVVYKLALPFSSLMRMAEESASMTMESQMKHASSSKKRPGKKDKLHLEDYIHFLDSRQTLHLTMSQINEIIHIHGFKKIHHAPKKVLTDAVDALDLVDLTRSTLRQSVSAFAVLKLEDAIADLNELNWQECCVTSLQKLSSWNESFFPGSSSSDQKDLQLANHSNSKSQTQLVPKTRRIEEIYSPIPETFQNSLRATKMVPRRKRSNAHALDCGASTVDSVSLASC